MKLVGVAREKYTELQEQRPDPVVSTLLHTSQPPPNTAPSAGGVVNTSTPLGKHSDSKSSIHSFNIHAHVFTPRHLNVQAPEFISHQN